MCGGKVFFCLSLCVFILANYLNLAQWAVFSLMKRNNGKLNDPLDINWESSEKDSVKLSHFLLRRLKCSDRNRSKVFLVMLHFHL